MKTLILIVFILSPTLLAKEITTKDILESLDLCSSRSSFGQLCKVDNPKRTFNEYINDKEDRLSGASIKEGNEFVIVEGESWFYKIDIIESKNNKAILEMTDEAKKGSYYAISEMLVEFDKYDQRWIVIKDNTLQLNKNGILKKRSFSFKKEFIKNLFYVFISILIIIFLFLNINKNRKKTNKKSNYKNEVKDYKKNISSDNMMLFNIKENRKEINKKSNYKSEVKSYKKNITSDKMMANSEKAGELNNILLEVIRIQLQLTIKGQDSISQNKDSLKILPQDHFVYGYLYGFADFSYQTSSIPDEDSWLIGSLAFFTLIYGKDLGSKICMDTENLINTSQKFKDGIKAGSEDARDFNANKPIFKLSDYMNGR